MVKIITETLAGFNYKKCLGLAVMFAAFATTAAEPESESADANIIEMITIADAGSGTKTSIHHEGSDNQQGDLFVFAQPLTSADGTIIGTNNGYCIMTAAPDYNDCQWTLTFNAGGSIVVGGEESTSSDKTSTVPILGGTGMYAGITGELVSTPENGKFRQVLKFRLPLKK